MRRKAITAVTLLCVVLAAPLGFAQGVGGQSEATGAQVTQGELADILVNVLGLARFLPAAASLQEKGTILMDNGIQPANGWEFDAVVTRADLARVIVLAMKQQDQVENPDDPRSWITYLASIGVSIDTVGDATDELGPLAEPVAPNVYVVSATTDPLKKRSKFGEPDESEYGTDVEFVAHWRPISLHELREIIVQVEFPPVQRVPATPT